MEDFLTKFLSSVSAKVPKPEPLPATKNDPLSKYLEGIKQKAEANQAALMDKSPFIKNLMADTQKVAGAAGSAVDKFLGESARNLKDAATGRLGATPSDYGEGTLQVLRGIGKGAQAFNQGTLSFGKSLMQGVYGKDIIDQVDDDTGSVARRLLADLTGEEDVSTAQDIVPAVEEYARSRGATDGQAATLGTLGFIGLMAANNPGFGGSKALNFSDDVIKGLAKATDDVRIAETLVEGGVSQETASKLAPVFRNAGTTREVKAVIEDIRNGVRVVDQVAGDDVAGVTLRERGYGRSVADTFDDINYEPERYIQRNTEAGTMRANEIIDTDIKKAEARVLGKELSDEVSFIGNELIKRYSRQLAETTDEVLKETISKQLADTATALARKYTEAGRFNQAATTLRQLTPEGKVAFVARQIEKNNAVAKKASEKVPELTPEKSSEILTKYRTIDEMPDGFEKEKAFQLAEEELAREFSHTPWWKKLITLWKAGLLTGLRTTGLNFASTAIKTGIDGISKVPAAGADVITSLITGERAVTAGTGVLRNIKKGLRQGTDEGGGLVEGFKKGVEYFKSGYDERRIRDLNAMSRVNFGNSTVGKAAEKYTEFVFRALGSAEMPFYYGARSASIYDQALAASKNLKLRGAEKQKFIDDFLQNPPDEAVANATADAMQATFTNNTVLGSLGVKLQNIPGVEVLVPFARTPGAVATSVLQYSPAGPLLEVFNQAAKGEFKQRDLSMAIGKGITGTGIMALGVALYNSGNVSLNRPDLERERNQSQLENVKPNQIKIGNRWVNAAALGPVGLQMVLGGYLARGMKETGSVTSSLAQTALGAATILSEQSYMQGLSNFMDAVGDPERFAESYVGNLLGSTIPTIVSDVGAGIDPYERRRESMGDYFTARMPFWREQLEPQVNVLGEKVGLPIEAVKDPWRRTGSFIKQMIDFTKSGEEKTDPLIQELRRLQDAGFSATPTLVGKTKEGYSSLSKDENTKLFLGAGGLVKQKLTALINTPAYQAADDDAKKKAINKFADKAKEDARASLIAYLTAGLSVEDLKQDLAAHKASGLMSEAVFDLYNEKYRQ